MNGLGFLDLIIGLSFIYFILGLVVSVVQEIRANMLRLRFHTLEAWISDTFAKGKLAKEIMRHDLFTQLVKKGMKPLYLLSNHFVRDQFISFNVLYWLKKLLELLISALAVSLSAPFRYTLLNLNKLVSLRVGAINPKLINL